MSEPTSDAQDFADYTDDHQDKDKVRPDQVAEQMTPDVAEAPEHEPPD
jgi:hypothetical protein